MRERGRKLLTRPWLRSNLLKRLRRFSDGERSLPRGNTPGDSSVLAAGGPCALSGLWLMILRRARRRSSKTPCRGPPPSRPTEPDDPTDPKDPNARSKRTGFTRESIQTPPDTVDHDRATQLTARPHPSGSPQAPRMDHVKGAAEGRAVMVSPSLRTCSMETISALYG